jgi:hypothetical protein
MQSNKNTKNNKIQENVG